MIRNFNLWHPDFKIKCFYHRLSNINNRKHILTTMSKINYLCFYRRKEGLGLQSGNPKNSIIRKRNSEASATLGTCRIIGFLCLYISAKSASGYASTLKILEFGSNTIPRSWVCFYYHANLFNTNSWYILGQNMYRSQQLTVKDISGRVWPKR